MCYRDRSYCEDSCLCAVPEKNCNYKLTQEESERALVLKLPIAWMSFKDTCPDYKEFSK